MHLYMVPSCGKLASSRPPYTMLEVAELSDDVLCVAVMPSLWAGKHSGGQAELRSRMFLTGAG